MSGSRRLLVTAAATACFLFRPVLPAAAGGALREPLPPPVTNPRSTEICMNSRLSYHGGWNAAGTEQMLADVLHAAASARATGMALTIYAATAQNVYIYDAAAHALVLHRPGNWRSDATAAFEVGFAAPSTIDAGAAMHLAQLESVALWTGTASQLASCPRASAATYANANWNPTEPIDIVVSFGMRSVAGLTTSLVAVSSDGTLPDPRTDGPVFLDDALDALAYDSTFAATSLTPAEVSQVLWTAYGCSSHYASGGRAGLVCSSAVANYYLTRRVYVVGPDGVHRFHNRRPPGTDLTTRDHRLELVRAGDVRPALRSAISRLADAPHYLIICVGSTGGWPDLEVGFAGAGALLAASSMDLQAYWTQELTAAEQSAVRAATGVPAADIPMLIVSVGRPADVAVGDLPHGQAPGGGLAIENRLPAGAGVTIRYALAAESDVDLAIYDCTGHEVRQLVDSRQGPGPQAATWDGRDRRAEPVPSGVYFCRLKAGRLARSAQVVIVR